MITHVLILYSKLLLRAHTTGTKLLKNMHVLHHITDDKCSVYTTLHITLNDSTPYIKSTIIHILLVLRALRTQ